MIFIAFSMSSTAQLCESLELRCFPVLRKNELRETKKVGDMKCQTGTQNNFSNPLFNHPDEDRGN